MLQKSASKFTTRGEWKAAEPSAYKAANVRGILDEVCTHMLSAYKEKGHWTKENVLRSASKFNTISDWNAAETTAVQRARKHGWLEEATAHMESNSVPIGPLLIHQHLLTHNIEYVAEKRFKDFAEVSKKPFDFFIPSLNLLVEYHGKQHQLGWKGDEESKKTIQLNDNIKKNWAIKNGYDFLEIASWSEKSNKAILSKLRASLLFCAEKNKVPLNTLPRELTKAELRKLHSGLVFTEEFILEDAKKYRTRADWLAKSPKAYRFALRHHLEELATSHMNYVTEHGKWTKEAILASAKKFTTIAEWRKNEESAYVIASRNRYLDEVKEFLTTFKKPNGYWTKERVIESARHYANASDWRKSQPSVAAIARRNRWLDEVKASFVK